MYNSAYTYQYELPVYLSEVQAIAARNHVKIERFKATAKAQITYSARDAVCAAIFHRELDAAIKVKNEAKIAAYKNYQVSWVDDDEVNHVAEANYEAATQLCLILSTQYGEDRVKMRLK